MTLVSLLKKKMRIPGQEPLRKASDTCFKDEGASFHLKKFWSYFRGN